MLGFRTNPASCRREATSSWSWIDVVESTWVIRLFIADQMRQRNSQTKNEKFQIKSDYRVRVVRPPLCVSFRFNVNGTRRYFSSIRQPRMREPRSLLQTYNRTRVINNVVLR